MNTTETSIPTITVPLPFLTADERRVLQALERTARMREEVKDKEQTEDQEKMLVKVREAQRIFRSIRQKTSPYHEIDWRDCPEIAPLVLLTPYMLGDVFSRDDNGEWSLLMRHKVKALTFNHYHIYPGLYTGSDRDIAKFIRTSCENHIKRRHERDVNSARRQMSKLKKEMREQAGKRERAQKQVSAISARKDRREGRREYLRQRNRKHSPVIEEPENSL